MTARSVVLKFMVASPAILTLSVVFESRFGYDPYEFTVPTQQQIEHVRAYTPIVQETDALDLPKEFGFNVAPLRKVASKWLALQQSGTLRPLTPAAYDDNVQDGPKWEIFNSGAKLAAMLASYSALEERKGEYDKAAQDAIFAVSLPQILKYSDFGSLSVTCMMQRRSVDLISRIAAHVSEVRKAELLNVLAKLDDSKALSEMALTARRQYADYQLRQGIEPTNIEDVKRLVSFNSIVSPSGDPKTMVRELESPNFVSAERDANLNVVSTISLGYRSVLQLRNHLTRAVKALKG